MGDSLDFRDYGEEWSAITINLIHKWDAFYRTFRENLNVEDRDLRDTVTTWLTKIYGQYPEHMGLYILEAIHLFDVWYLDNHDTVVVRDLQSYACACMIISSKVHNAINVFNMRWWARITRHNCSWRDLCVAELSVLKWCNWNVQVMVPEQPYTTSNQLMYYCVYAIVWCTNFEWANLFDFEDTKRRIESEEFVTRNQILLEDGLPTFPGG